MLRSIKLSRLVLDYNLYPRQKIESYNVTQMVEAMKAGAIFPPVVVDKSSLRVTDGWHRIRAYQQLYDDTKIQVDLRDYKNEAEMFTDAMKLNASHGRQLSMYDKAHCIAKSVDFKLELDIVSSLLNLTPQRVTEMRQERSATYEMKPITLKRTAAHLAGKELTTEQVEYNLKAGGMSQTFYINQLVSMIESDAVDWENPQVVSALKKLSDLLDQALMVTS